MPTATTTADGFSVGVDGAADVEVDISIACSEWERALPDFRTMCRSAVAAALAAASHVVETRDATEDASRNAPHDLSGAEISLVLTDDVFIRDLNCRYRDVDRATNVLAFPGGETVGRVAGAPVLLGDVIVAYETAAAEAAAENKALANHVSHLIVHGTLHLLGYDHQADNEAETMEGLEIEALALLGIANPYADPA
ncbi:MAG: rRNA maturation RNase YbeY [Rhodospirillales bacterium]